MYMQQPVKESDWKLFRKRLPEWQEQYMSRLLQEYMEMLGNEKEKASTRFWGLDKRLKADKRDVGVIAEMSRSKMHGNLIALLDEGAITLDDLEGFSEELQESMKFIFKNRLGK